MFADGKPYLFLEQEDGKADRIDSGVLVQWLCQLSRRPVLIVLASCQSAGDRSDGSALAAFGPRLVTEAGIGAVVAMHGNVPIQTVQEFMPPFFEELHRDGAIDRAVAAARRSMGISSKWWLPVLFLRMRDGQLWHEPESPPPHETRAHEHDEHNEHERNGAMKKGIPTDLYHPLRRTLLACGPFNSESAIQRVFSHELLRPWQNKLPQAENREARVEATMAFLSEQQRSDTGDNVLVILLRVLAEGVDPGDECHHRLKDLAEKLAAALSGNPTSHSGSSSGSSGSAPTSGNPDVTYNIPAIQELINKGFSAQEVEHLCFYHFREVYDDFVPEMSKQAKIRRWVEYCDGKSEFPDLLALLKEKNPKKYAEFESRLTMEP
jgi:hypothetical protein